MATPISPDNTGFNKNLSNLKTSERIQLWQHFVSTGGTDKERMITITTWLLAFSATLLGYGVIEAVDFAKLCIKVPSKAYVSAFLGICVSIFALCIVLAYHIHATWNWKKATQYAPEGLKLGDRPLAQSWVFYLFYVVALSFLIVHTVVFSRPGCPS
jgi:hypothetical protein